MRKNNKPLTTCMHVEINENHDEPPNNVISYMIFVKLICIIAGEKNLVGIKPWKMFCGPLLGVTTWRKKQIKREK